MRSDAVRHREIILDAAEAVFAEHGPLAPLTDVVARAAVGRATLYRNFADREALIDAVLERGFERLQQHAEALRSDDSAILTYLRGFAHEMADKAAIMDFWASQDPHHPRLAEIAERFVSILKPLLRKTKAAGLCRQDLKPIDLILCSAALTNCRGFGNIGEKHKLVDRLVDLLFSGIQAQK